jgi:hypothetical protein
MIVSEALASFLISLNEKYSLPQIDEPDEKNLTEMKQIMLCNLKDNQKESIAYIFDVINEGSLEDILDNDASKFVTTCKKCELISLTDVTFKRRLRRFAISDTHGIVIPFDFFLNPQIYDICDGERDTLKRAVLEIIIYFVLNNRIGEFLNHLLHMEENYGIIVNKKNDIINIQFYSYLYMKYLLLGYSTPIDDTIRYQYNMVTELEEDLTKCKFEKDFNQFFEIFDAIDEYNMCDDLVARYFKIYQIIEYLVYRFELVQIQKRSEKSKTFLIELMKTSTRYAQAEKNMFTRNFQKVFEEEKAQIVNDFKTQLRANPSVMEDIEKAFNIKFTRAIENDNDNDIYTKFPLLLYNIRNSIVHNKESELHLTLHNLLSEYKNLAEVIKMVLPILEKAIFTSIISMCDTITYSSSVITLY